MTRVALYARVSTFDKNQNPEVQLQALRQWATAQGIDLDPALTYVDLASGTKAHRASLDRLMEDAHRRRFDELWIWALDRLSREGIAKCGMRLEQLKSYGVRVRSLQESWLDTGSPLPVTELLVSIFAWIAKQERDRMSERIKAGIARRKAMGLPHNAGQRIIKDESAIAAYLHQTKNVSATARHFGVSNAWIRKVRARRPDLFGPVNGHAHVTLEE